MISSSPLIALLCILLATTRGETLRISADSTGTIVGEVTGIDRG
jgi:hypothetical protein